MASAFRYLVTVTLAAFITLSAFYLMHRLIDDDTAAPVSRDAVTVIRFGPVDIPEAPEPDRPEPPPEPEPQEPPPRTNVIATTEPIDRPVDIDRSLTPTPGPEPIYQATFPSRSGRDSATARPVAAVPPPYPREAAMNGIEGWVRLAVDIDERGRVRDVEVLSAEPRGVFDQAAVQAVRRWSWKPAIVDGEPRAQRVVQELTFELDEA